MSTKPPLPGSAARDSFQIALIAWAEMLSALVVLLAFYVFLEKRLGSGMGLAFLALTGVSLLLVLKRTVRRVIALRNAKGPMRGKTLQVFWAALLAPLLFFGLAWQLRDLSSPFERKQEEARASLLALVEAENSFKRDYGRFTFNVKELGGLEREGVRIYALGFPTACSIKEGATLEKSRILFNEYPLSEMRRLKIEEYLQNVRRPEDCPDPKEGFEAYAAGVLKEGAPLDIWRVDESGALTNVQKGY